jgi:hypothetical protein
MAPITATEPDQHQATQEAPSLTAT